jgi:muramidase (phage lysozyme)
LEDVLAGRFDVAIYKCRKEWASLPGAGYGQGERSFTSLVQVYQYAGGQMAA